MKKVCKEWFAHTIACRAWADENKKQQLSPAIGLQIQN